MLILNASNVTIALPMSEAIAAMKSAFAALCQGKANVPPRAHLSIAKHDGVTLVMPAHVDGENEEALAVKVVSVFNRNAERNLARIQAAVLVVDPQTGQPIAMLEGASLTGIRTAAASGAATDLMARGDSRTVAILGAGVQARTHLEAMCTVRNIETAWIYSPTRAKVETMIAEMQHRPGVPSDLRVADSAGQAISQADIICTTTTASTPVFDDADVRDGTHINAVGSYQPHVREIPTETVVRSRVVVDQREAAWEEAGDLIQPLEAGSIDRNHIVADLGELVRGQKIGRENDGQITFFKSVGVSVQDAMAASTALTNAKRLGLGQQVSW